MNKRMKDRIVDAATRLSLFLGGTGFHGALKAQEAPEPDSLRSINTEIVDKRQNSASITQSHDTTRTEVIDTPYVEPINAQELVRADERFTLSKDSISKASYDLMCSKNSAIHDKLLDGYKQAANRYRETVDDSVLAIRRENLKNAEEYMVYLIAHFEGFKSRAYWDPYGKCWTYGVGNCEKANGTKVVRGDAIRTEEEGVAVVTHHIDKNMADDMVKYLPMEHMSEVEIAVMGSLLYNTGSGKLRNKDRSPSELSDIATIYFVHRTQVSEYEFNNKYLSYKRAKSGANILLDRRENEYAILSGEVDLPIEKLKGTMLGALHGCHGDADKIEERFAPDSKLACPTDSLHYAMKQDLARTYVRKSTPTKSKTPTRGRMQPRPRSRTR